MDPLQELLTQRALAQPQMNQAPQLPNVGSSDPGSLGQDGYMPMNQPPSGNIGVNPTIGSMMGAMGPQMQGGQMPSMRMPSQAPQQPQQGAPYQPQDSANDRNYV